MDREFDAWARAADGALGEDLLHLVVASAAAAANRPEAVRLAAERRLAEVGQAAPDQAAFVLRAREAMVKMAALMGTPRAINALQALAAAVPAGGALERALAAAPALRSDADCSHARMRARGLELFGAIYGPNAPRVEARLRALSPDLAEVVVVDSYGRLLGEARRLGARDTELCAVGCLVPLDVPAQLKSHCIGAARLGATDAMVQAALRLARLVCRP
ncbi:hypothetical protein H4R18_001138 [Coemansia javaensis]|uniref:Uncharacterized protein n=1 Tax=Coemansia javaensis TaxID=2761396 RepID=A0A9W8HG59_9FUNG|nr:hypothetical protein H4R18_001138 [Coemansia javaensis]